MRLRPMIVRKKSLVRIHPDLIAKINGLAKERNRQQNEVLEDLILKGLAFDEAYRSFVGEKN